MLGGTKHFILIALDLHQIIILFTVTPIPNLISNLEDLTHLTGTMVLLIQLGIIMMLAMWVIGFQQEIQIHRYM